MYVYVCLKCIYIYMSIFIMCFYYVCICVYMWVPIYECIYVCVCTHISTFARMVYVAYSQQNIFNNFVFIFLYCSDICCWETTADRLGSTWPCRRAPLLLSSRCLDVLYLLHRAVVLPRLLCASPARSAQWEVVNN